MSLGTPITVKGGATGATGATGNREKLGSLNFSVRIGARESEGSLLRAAAQSLTELLGLPDWSVQGVGRPGVAGMSGREARYLSRLLLNTGRDQSSLLKGTGREVKSLGPSIINDCSLREITAALEPDRGGISTRSPLLESGLSTRDSPQLGTRPVRIFQV